VRREGSLPTLMLAALLLAASAPRASAEGALPKTHAAMLDSVAAMAAADLLRGGPIPPGHAVRIATPLAGDTLGFLAQRLVEQLRRSGTEVRLVPTHATADAGIAEDPPARAREDSTDLVLQVEVRSAGVSYVRAVKKFPLGVKGYQRLATMQAGASLLDPVTHGVLWARTASAQASDLVRRGDLNIAQTGSASLVPVPPRGGGTRLLEPLIVVGVVTGLVVLFYSNRN
jgi:hypothetical protein